MRAAPPLVITVARFGVWRCFTAALCAFTAAVVVAWVVLRLEWAPAAWPAMLAALAVTALSLACSRRESFELRWDGQAWHGLRAGQPLLSGRLDVMLDAQGWLLLRLRCHGRSHRDAVWIPVQRRGLEASWHALRAAVYSPTHDRRHDAGPVE